MKNRLSILIALIFLFQIAILIIVSIQPFHKAVQSRWTPIPTLAPATLVPPGMAGQLNFGLGDCEITALDLIGAWVHAGTPETQQFGFLDQNGNDCLATFEQDVMPLFTQPNIWYPGAIACSSCHGSNLSLSAAQLSLAAYEDILAGSRRSNHSTQGEDILGSKDGWEKSKLYIQIFTKQMPVGRPDSSPPKGPNIRVGELKPHMLR